MDFIFIYYWMITALLGAFLLIGTFLSLLIVISLLILYFRCINTEYSFYLCFILYSLLYISINPLFIINISIIYYYIKS